jgi:hypothetical protein
LCGRSQGGCGGGRWAWNWLRDRGKQNEFFFLQRRRFLKANYNFLSNRRKVERADTEKVTNITSGGLRKLRIPTEESYCTKDNAFIILKIQFSEMHNVSVMLRFHWNS